MKFISNLLITFYFSLFYFLYIFSFLLFYPIYLFLFKILLTSNVCHPLIKLFFIDTVFLRPQQTKHYFIYYFHLFCYLLLLFFFIGSLQGVVHNLITLSTQTKNLRILRDDFHQASISTIPTPSAHNLGAQIQNSHAAPHHHGGASLYYPRSHRSAGWEALGSSSDRVRLLPLQLSNLFFLLSLMNSK